VPALLEGAQRALRTSLCEAASNLEIPLEQGMEAAARDAWAHTAGATLERVDRRQHQAAHGAEHERLEVERLADLPDAMPAREDHRGGVRRISHPMIVGDRLPKDLVDDDPAYVVDLGLVRAKGGERPAPYRDRRVP
jgi:hypothetical protein